MFKFHLEIIIIYVKTELKLKNSSLIIFLSLDFISGALQTHLCTKKKSTFVQTDRETHNLQKKSKKTAKTRQCKYVHSLY